jgi:hypothetical protein
MARARWCSLVIAALLPAVVAAQGGRAAQRFVLDYDVPESPAFIALGVTPATVTRGSASKPVVASLLNDLATGKKLVSGVAVDFAPYFLYGGQFRCVNEYRHSRLKRWLANTLISIATVQSETDSNSLRFGIGARVTLFDSHDLLQDSTLGADIDTALIGAVHVGVGADTSEVGAPVLVPGLAEAYTAARERVRRKRGGALSVGWGLAGLVRGSIAARDSIGSTRSRVWVSYRQTLGRGMDLLAIGQWRQLDSAGSSLRVGAALRTNTSDASFAAELYYDANPSSVGGGKLGGGANVEWRLMRGMGVVVAVSTVPTVSGTQTVPRLRVRTSLRWGMHSER